MARKNEKNKTNGNGNFDRYILKSLVKMYIPVWKIPVRFCPIKKTVGSYYSRDHIIPKRDWWYGQLLCFIELIAKLWQLIQPDPQGLAINSVGPGRLALFFSFFSRLGGGNPPREKKSRKTKPTYQVLLN